MAGTTFPQGTSVSIASQAQWDPAAPKIRETSLDREGLPRRHDPSPDALSLIWFFVALFGGLFVLAVLLRLFS